MRYGIWGALILLAAAGGTPGWAATNLARPDHGTFIGSWENDGLISSADYYYSSGVELLWVSPPLGTSDPWLAAASRRALEKLPPPSPGDPTKYVALSLGQKIFTPRDINSPALQVTDRPYAGWSYGGLALHYRSVAVLDTVELNLGLVGPQSYARETQAFFHELVEKAEPQGWQHQLRNEPGVVAVYERKWRSPPWGLGNFHELQLIRHLGGALGNVYTHANGGAEIRLGHQLPDDFGTGLMLSAPRAGVQAPAHAFGFHLFAAFDGRLVVRNLFLDGNTFTDSHWVSKEKLVADLSLGASLSYGRCTITFAHVYRTKEFERQPNGQRFGALQVALAF